MDFEKELYEMRKSFRADRSGVKLPSRPTWMKGDDKLNCIYTNKERTLRYGEVYYAMVVQANKALFESVFPLDLLPDCNNPANLIFSDSRYLEAEPMILGDIARELFSYKAGDRPVPEEYREIVAYIRDEYDRSMVQFRPVGMEDMVVNFIATLVFRPFLPKRYLRSSLIPVIASTDIPDSAIILPKKYWTDAFTDAWVNRRF